MIELLSWINLTILKQRTSQFYIILWSGFKEKKAILLLLQFRTQWTTLRNFLESCSQDSENPV